MPREAVAKVEG